MLLFVLFFTISIKCKYWHIFEQITTFKPYNGDAPAEKRKKEEEDKKNKKENRSILGVWQNKNASIMSTFSLGFALYYKFTRRLNYISSCLSPVYIFYYCMAFRLICLWHLNVCWNAARYLTVKMARDEVIAKAHFTKITEKHNNSRLCFPFF